MVFRQEGQFQQFPHCKFRENIVRLLHIPCLVDQARSHSPSAKFSTSHFFLAVNKFGKVGLYHPDTFTLVHTYCLDLSVPVVPRTSSSSNPPIVPKCERTHLVTDAVYSSDTHCVIFSTTKCILQLYDIGEIQKQDIGLSIFPRKEFLNMRESSFPVTNIPNKGHVESHRLLGLQFIPTCLEYHGRKLIIGDVDGGVTLIGIPKAKCPLGRRKIRGMLHQIQVSELPHGVVQYYKAHHSPITDIHLISERNLILTSSKDKKFSVYVKDTSNTPMESIIVSLPKGVNSLAYSNELKMVATGSDDYVVRLFNQFVMKMPQMEMFGHRSPVVSVHFVQVDFFVVGAEQGDKPVLLLSYSSDSELRAWDPLTFICLQSLYLSFPVGSTIMCKTPEFATKSLVVYQQETTVEDAEGKSTTEGHEKSKKSRRQSSSVSKKGRMTATPAGYGTIILLYCNSYARIPLEKEGATRWPGVDYDQFIREFEELSMEYDRKLKEKMKGDNPNPPKPVPVLPVVFQQAHRYQSAPTAIQEEIGEDDEEEEEDSIKMEDRHSHDNVCLRLSHDELSEMDRKVEKYLQEILELRQTLKGGRERSVSILGPSSSAENTGRFSESTSLGGGGEEDRESSPIHTVDPLAISIHATNKYFQFQRAKQSQFQGLPRELQRTLSYGQAFSQYPLLDLQPIQFSRSNLAMPEDMKKQLGLQSLSSVQDLVTPEARRYFGIDLSSSRHTRNSSGGGGGSFFYNFNHSRQKQKKRVQIGHDDSGHHDWSDARRTADIASRFTVVGQKIRQDYETDHFMASNRELEEEDEEDHLVTVDKNNVLEIH